MKRIFVIAALATFATAAQAQDNNAAATTTTTSTSTTAAAAPAAAAGTSVSAIQDPEAAVKGNWVFSALTQIGMDSSEVNYLNRTDKTVSATNFVGLGYKIDKENRIGFKQYFETSHDGDSKQNKMEMSYPVVTYGHTFNGFAKSEPVAATFWYYVPTVKAARDVQSNGILRADSEFVWTLNPKWAVSYFLSPRQSIIPTETSVLDEKSGKSLPVFTKSTLVHFATVYYTVNDDVTFYTNVGFNQAWKTSNFNLASEKYLTYVGASFNFFGGKLNINPEIDYEIPLPSSSENLQAMSTYNEANVSYLLTAAVVF